MLGFDYLRAAPIPAVVETVASSQPDALLVALPIFVGDVPTYGIVARGKQVEGEFVVLAGSTARRHWEGAQSPYTALFNDLVGAGILVPTADNTLNRFTKDYSFKSPSAAAAVVAGRPANGRTHWRVEGSNITYAAWQEGLLGTPTTPLGPAA